jgi:hypothetical protein
MRASAGVVPETCQTRWRPISRSPSLRRTPKGTHHDHDRRTVLRRSPLRTRAVHFEENYDLTGQLLRGGQRDAEHAKRGIVLVYSRVDDQHSQVSLQPQAGVASEEMLTEAIERLATIRDEAAAARMSIDMLGWLDAGPQWRLTEVPRC